MVILGIDPGISRLGYALLENQGGTLRILKTGLVTTGAQASEKKLAEIFRRLSDIIKRYHPEAMALERLFFTQNQKTAMAVAEARGVILLTAALAGLRVYEYTPLEVKKTITGDGKADKLRLKKMLGFTLKGVRDIKAEDDVFDALAIALTCQFKERPAPP